MSFDVLCSIDLVLAHIFVTIRNMKNGYSSIRELYIVVMASFFSAGKFFQNRLVYFMSRYGVSYNVHISSKLFFYCKFIEGTDYSICIIEKKMNFKM